ncbi:IPTL-CTERM sorting domain-containing protein [Brevundimonas sp. NIBR11]|uniref:IPTL-CTERM sorting domain-containing protein n=1 Tax=Brevundimonas sp. NIBR11 TaxID=3015999 RepID=UPI0022F1214D|nr:IPTL-CTERM sorting domain-containing protein [Brevundimonas sp. NIBR11]WGM32183.1 hypothetical protein KKHFBJBL_02434 [Brevundimonas sp. NIBR11]
MHLGVPARVVALLLAFGAGATFPAAANAQTNLVTNGSFEADGATITVPPTGWSRAPSPNCGFVNRTGGAGYPAATQGTYIANVAFGQTNINCQFYQDVAIPAASNVTLGFAVGALLSGRTGTLSVSVVPTVGAPLVVYTAPANTDVTLAEVTPIDISAYSGQTVRLQIDANSGNYFNGYLDNFRINAVAAPPPAPVPTLSEWALLLLGTILAAGAALYIQRRRLTV